VKEFPGNAHILGAVFDPSGAEGLDVHFNDGEVLRLRWFTAVDASIYGQEDGWSAEIVACITSQRGGRFHPGKGLDFKESDVVAVRDPWAGKALYSRGTTEPGRAQT
jgi:hypothetical protein